MKTLFVIIVGLSCFSQVSSACTYQTIDSMISSIDPYRSDQVGISFEAAIENLSLCDENLDYAGRKLASTFDPYREESTQIMTKVILNTSAALRSEIVGGLGLGLINQIDMYRHNSTIYMLRTIIQLGTDHQEYAKQFALELLKKADPYREATNNELLKAVKTLRELAQSPVTPETPSSIWSFKSEDRTCKTMNGPWGEYYPCPKYTASVSDNKGNRLILTCRSNEAGINFRIRPSREFWNNIWNSTLETISFGTDKINQQMGVPYMVGDDQAIYVEEPISEELLMSLRADNVLNINMRLNSGESSAALTYRLAGSNQAISKLMSYCQ